MHLLTIVSRDDFSISNLFFKNKEKAVEYIKENIASNNPFGTILYKLMEVSTEDLINSGIEDLHLIQRRHNNESRHKSSIS